MSTHDFRLSLINAVTAPTARRARANPGRAFGAIADQVRDEFDLTLTGPDAEAIEQLETVTKAFTAIPGLSGVGWMSVKTMVTRRLRTRYRVRQLHQRHPQIADQTIDQPIFVVGLPRTATTLTHTVLANAPGCRGPRLWEMYYPDLPQSAAVERRRSAETQREMDQVLNLSRSWNRIHPVRSGWPEEIFFLLTQMRMHATIGPMDDYVASLDGCDKTGDYMFVREVMQVLQYQRERPRWVLKHPGCIEDLTTIMRVFPDATIVWTHRDPYTVIGSLCSMIESIERMHRHRGAIDRHDIGRRWLRYTAAMAQTGRSMRVDLPRGSIIDLSYHTLMANPHLRVPELFAQLGLPWTDDDHHNLAEAIDRPRDRTGHAYAAESYGIDHTDVDRAFGDYAQMVAGLSSRGT